MTVVYITSVQQDSEWADSDDGDENLIQGLKQDEFAYLSEILGNKPGQFDEDEDELDGGLDDEDLKQDPVSTMDMKARSVRFARCSTLLTFYTCAGSSDLISARMRTAKRKLL